MRKAFSLIEVLVAISIMGIMTSFVVIQTNYSNRLQAVKATAAELKQALNTAKANAQSGRKDCTMCGAVGGLCGEASDTPLYGWTVDINATNYYIQGTCNGGATVFYNAAANPTNFSSLVSLDMHGLTSVSFTFMPGDKVVKSGGTWPVAIDVNASGVPTVTILVTDKGEIL